MMFKQHRPWHSRRVLGISLGVLSAMAVGALVLAGFNDVMALTNSERFCISCHEMNDTVYQEYRQSAHFKTQSGVGASCPDCHVPQAFWPKLVRKVQASAEIYHKLVGTIDTPEKFEARRKLLAERVWQTMRETDSRECRSCHLHERMALELQDKRTRKKHGAERMLKRGETCIDCHQGLVHELPEEV
jgi:cytochrome c-type protein NapC